MTIQAFLVVLLLLSLTEFHPYVHLSFQKNQLQSNRYGNALKRTLQRNDVVAMAERRRRHLVTTPDNFTGCRCCYDPNSDGGEYAALIDLREKRANENGALMEKENVDNENNQQQQKEILLESQPVGESKNEATDDSDDEFDYLLDEDFGENDSMLKQAEERRRAELEMAILTQQIVKQHGYGVHRQMHPTRILRAAGLGERKRNDEIEIAPAVVIHLVDPESVASASLDLFLEELAGTGGSEDFNKNIRGNQNHTFVGTKAHYFNLAPGTKFMRSGGRATLLMDADLAGKVLPRLQPDRDLPALIAVRDGIVVNTCPRLSGLLTTDPVHDEVDTDAVYQWLDRSGVLLPQPPRIDEVCRIRPEEEALLDYLEVSAAPKVEEVAERFDCGNPDCHKSFPHEHVGMQNEQQSGLVVSEEEVLGK